jgi:hypothetical protein
MFAHTGFLAPGLRQCAVVFNLGSLEHTNIHIHRIGIYIHRVGQNRKHTPYMTVCMVASLLKTYRINIHKQWFGRTPIH